MPHFCKTCGNKLSNLSKTCLNERCPTNQPESYQKTNTRDFVSEINRCPFCKHPILQLYGKCNNPNCELNTTDALDYIAATPTPFTPVFYAPRNKAKKQKKSGDEKQNQITTEKLDSEKDRIFKSKTKNFVVGDVDEEK